METDLRETVAEKLARFRRIMFGRDLYDLAQIACLVRDDLQIIREMLLYKVYFDVVDDGRGAPPFGSRRSMPASSPEMSVSWMSWEHSLGVRSTPGEMLGLVEGVFGGMAEPSAVEVRLGTVAACRANDRWQVAAWMREWAQAHRARAT